MTTEMDNEELENLKDEKRDKEVAKTLANLKEKYKDLFGNAPANTLTFADIQNKIRAELACRNLRPYKL